MSLPQVHRSQRFTIDNPCPICDGYENLPRSKGIRCYGFLSDDERYAHCTRPEYAGNLQLCDGSDTFAHRLDGDCACGNRHGAFYPSPYDGSNVQHESLLVWKDSNWRQVTEYTYYDKDGTVFFQVVRFECKDGTRKQFRQRRPIGVRQWVWNLDGVTPVLYRLPQLLKSDPAAPVFIVEGEKDADQLGANDFITTTNPMGANKWHDRYNESLEGRHVIIIEDNDDIGRQHAAKVANSLYGKVASVRVLRLDGLPEKGDVSDWLDLGHSADELRRISEAAPLWKLEDDEKPDCLLVPKGEETIENRGAEQLGFALTPLSNLLAEPEENAPWLVDSLLSSGGLSILGAKPKVGKSTLARNLALAVARGEDFLGCQTLQGAVVYLAFEEKRDEVRKHFQSMGGCDEPIYSHFGSAPQNPMDALERVITEHQAVLAIVDPLFRLLRVKDANDYASVSRAIEAFTDLARRTGCHILVAHHMVKGERSGGDGYLGSTALFGAVDTGLMMYRSNNVRTIESTQRYGNDLPQTTIALDPNTGIVTSTGAVPEHKQHQKGTDVLTILNDNWLTEQEVKERLGGNQKETADALRALLDSGVIARKGAGKKGDPYQYRHVAQPEMLDSLLSSIEEETIENGVGDELWEMEV